MDINQVKFITIHSKLAIEGKMRITHKTGYLNRPITEIDKIKSMFEGDTRYLIEYHNFPYAFL